MSLYTIFFVKELQASDGWVGLNTTLANIGVIFGNLIWRRIIAKVGDNRALLLSIPMSASYAFLVALIPELDVNFGVGDSDKLDKSRCQFKSLQYPG